MFLFLDNRLERAQTVSSLHPTPASAIEELPPSSSRITGFSAPPFREKSVIDLCGDREDVEVVLPQSEKIGQNSPLSALSTTEELRPAIPPATAARLPTPTAQRTSAITPHLSSPEVSTHEATSAKSSRVTPPLVAHGISGLLSSTPSYTIRTVTPIKSRGNANNSTLTVTPVLSTLPTSVIPPVQATKPATNSTVDGSDEELEEGEVKSDGPLAPPMNEKAGQTAQLLIQSHTAARAGPIPPLSLYFKPNQPIPPIPKNIPKKRPSETVVEGPIKKARPDLPPGAMGLPKGQTSIRSRSTTTVSSRPGTAERDSTHGSEGILKAEPKSPVLPSNAQAPSTPISTEVAASKVKPAYEDTAVTASDPPPGYEGSQKHSLASLITRELRRQDEMIYCHPCM